KGTYCLEVDLWNTNGVATGFDMQGSIKGGALISEQCCNPNSTITGAKFHDINCNGIWDFFDKDPLHPEKEPGLAGWTIQLCDSTGQLIASTQTDVFGYYTFFGIPPGDYSVKEVLQPDWVVDAPVGGVFPVQLDTLKVVGFLNFGNKYVGPLSFRDTFDCVVIGQEEAITWQGSPCDCPVTITLQNCDGGGEIILAAGLANTGTYYWTIPAVPEGFYQISIRNCDSTDTIISPCFEIRPGNIPTIQCPPNVTIDCSQSGYMLPDATFTTDCPCDPNHTPVYSKRYHGPYRCGLNTLTASIADKCGQASCTVTVTVLDTIPPTVVCPADLTLHTLPGLCYATSELPAVTGQDNCTNMPQITCFLVELGDTIPVTGENQFNLGVHTIFCSAKDNCGNLSATCQYNLTVVDDVPPTLICPADVTVTGSTVPDGVCRAVVNNIAAFATDNCFGVSLYYSLPGGVSGPGDASGNIFQGGPSTVFYTAIDLSGHPTFCAFQVTVLCPDSCCAGEEAFLAKVAAGFSVQRFDCGFQLKPVALSDCQLLNIQWGDGQTTGPVPANSHYSHTYAASGDYAICVKVEEFNNAGVACYSKDTCWTVCVQCDTCTMKTIDLDWYQDVAPTYSNFSGNNSNYYISYDPASDNFYVTGAFIGSAYKHNQVPQSPAASNTIGQNGFVSTYSRIGGALTSYFPFSSGSNFWENVQGAVIKPDPATHGFYLAGAFYGQVINLLADGSGLSFPIIASNVSPSHPNVFLARYNGVTDSWWGFAIGGNNDEQLNDLEIDSDGNIIIIGSAIGSIEFNPNGASVPVNSDDPFIYTAKYDPNGILIWVDIINDANVGEKDKGLGLTVDKLTNDIFICGEFYGHPEVFTKSQSSLSPSVSLGITTLSVLGSTGTPFAAKLFSSGAPGWAIGIQNTAKTSSGAAWDIDWEGDYVYLSGTVIESNTDEVEYGPLNSSLNTRKSGVRNYLVKYNKSNGYFICADWSLPANTLPAGTAIEEISILNNTLYLSGSRGNNMYVAIYGTDCNRLKSFETFGTDGLTDVSYSIAPDPFGGFAIVGNFTGPVFDPDPQANNNPEITTSSAGYNLFVGKYSCNCPKDSIEESCCEKLMVMAKKSPENSCCYTIDLKNNAGFDIHSLEVVLQTADWEFNNVQIGNGFTATQIGQLITLSGSPVIPAGTSPAAFLFCLKSLNTTASHAQTIIFNWYETLAGGKKHLICSDTLLSDCAPTCACSVWSPVTVKNKALNFGTSLNCTGQQPYPVLPCPAAAHPHTFSGQLRCTSCRASSISWTLLNPNSLPVLSNSTVGPFYS
ncbi:MAG: SdrD B-like domain-containing protein, partial [Saprospiraceae bacterium]